MYLTLKIKKNYILFDNDLSEDDFLNKIKNIIGILYEDDYFKLGLDLAEFIVIKSGLFKFDNRRIDEKNNKKNYFTF
jgi:hypothetical protein